MYVCMHVCVYYFFIYSEEYVCIFFFHLFRRNPRKRTIRGYSQSGVRKTGKSSRSRELEWNKSSSLSLSLRSEMSRSEMSRASTSSVTHHTRKHLILCEWSFYNDIF
jgi:hypothetical protein